MKFDTMTDKEIESRFNQLIASTDATCGAPTHWFSANSVEAKREILSSVYRPGLTRLSGPKVTLSGGYTPYPPKETIDDYNYDDRGGMC